MSRVTVTLYDFIADPRRRPGDEPSARPRPNAFRGRNEKGHRRTLARSHRLRPGPESAQGDPEHQCIARQMKENLATQPVRAREMVSCEQVAPFPDIVAPGRLELASRSVKSVFGRGWRDNSTLIAPGVKSYLNIYLQAPLNSLFLRAI